MELSKLKIDPRSLGSTMFLTAVTPSYKYDAANKRTEEVEYYRYEVALPEYNLDKITVKIPGEKLMDVQPDSLEKVAFDGLEIRPYVMNGKSGLSCKASGIHKVKA